MSKPNDIPEFIVHSVPGSPYGRSVFVLLMEKGARYRLALWLAACSSCRTWPPSAAVLMAAAKTACSAPHLDFLEKATYIADDKISLGRNAILPAMRNRLASSRPG